MKKLLILLSIFFLLSNSNVNSAGRSDDAAAEAPASKKQCVEKKESKQETAPVGKSPIDTAKDREVLEELIKLAPLRKFPVSLLRVVLDYCKTKFQFAYSFSAHISRIESLVALNKTHFVSGSGDGTIKIWRFIPGVDGKPEKYECLHTLDRNNNGHNIFVCSLILLDATHFISGSADRTIKIWEYDSSTSNAPKCIHTLDRNNNGHTDWIKTLTKLDDTHFASGSTAIKIWQYDSLTDIVPKCIHTLDQRNGGRIDTVYTLMGLDDNHFVSGSEDKTIKIWKFNPRAASVPPKCIKTLNHNNGGHNNFVKSLIKLDETHFASCSYDSTIKIWKFIPASTGTPMQCRCIKTLNLHNGGHEQWVMTLIKLDERHFASGSIDKTIKIWKFIPATASTLAACICIQTLNIDQISKLLTRMSNGDLIAGTYGSIQVFKPVVDIE